MMHLKLLVFLLAIFPFFSDIENPFAETIALSKKEGKQILLVFSGSDWCHGCMHFKQQVLDKQTILREIEQNYIIHNVDFPRNNSFSKEKVAENKELAEAYNPEGVFPRILVIDHKQTKSQVIPYSPGAEKEFLRALSH
ncbi:MAG: thioredoxin family protein [Cyclobacteriaceae bacterium]